VRYVLEQPDRNELLEHALFVSDISHLKCGLGYRSGMNLDHTLDILHLKPTAELTWYRLEFASLWVAKRFADVVSKASDESRAKLEQLISYTDYNANDHYRSARRAQLREVMEQEPEH
jgi:hypothetical protein